MAKQTIYEMVTERIIQKLEHGVIPWRKPWNSSNQAVSWKTQKPYRGVNALLLDPGEYATFNQIQEAGGKVKKGAKGHLIVFWKWLDIENAETGEIEKVPFLRYYKGFEINTQCEGIKSKSKDAEPIHHDPIESAEVIIKGYQDAPPITFAPGKAYYVPAEDTISVPAITDYNIKQEYYSTLFHEMIHSTGHKKRLNRPGVTDKAAAFGTETYSKEELVAEMGAAMLCGVAGIENHTIENSASYISSWIRQLKGDPKLAVTAASAAQKAADYIQGVTYQD